MRELTRTRPLAGLSAWRMGVPVATPIACTDVMAGLSAITGEARELAGFEREVGQFLGTDYVRTTNSGRSALFLILSAMKTLNSRREVIIPAFACPSVGRAVLKAGLQPVLCDVGDNGSGLEISCLQRLLRPRTLAVVAAHLFGYPSDMARIMEAAHAVGAMLIEDAAQAFGARIGGRAAGTLGDAGMFSFGMSKVLWSVAGGAIVTPRGDLHECIDNCVSALPTHGIARQIVGMVKLASLATLLRCHHLGPLAALWGRALRGRDDCSDFSARQMPPANAAVARSLLNRYAEITATRCSNASFFATALAGRRDLILPQPAAGTEPACVRFPVIVKNAEIRPRLADKLRAVGINVSEMYGRESYAALRRLAVRAADCPRTEYLVDRILNLPTHTYVNDRDRASAVAVFDSMVGASAGSLVFGFSQPVN